MKPIYSKTKIMSAALALSALGLGVSMPSCPGNQAMQSQVDALQTSQADLNRKILALDSKMRIVDTDMPQIKQILAQMTSTIQAQKAALDQLDAAVKAVDAKASHGGGGAKAKAAPKKKGR